MENFSGERSRPASTKSNTLLSFLVGIACFLVGIFGIALIFSDETKETHYENIAQADKHGAIKRGWIPAWLPKTAHSLNEAHNIDTNWQVLTFKFDLQEEWTISHECKEIDANIVPPPYATYEWWPKNVPPSNSKNSDYEYFKCDASQSFAAINKKKGTGCHWSLPR